MFLTSGTKSQTPRPMRSSSAEPSQAADHFTQLRSSAKKASTKRHIQQQPQADGKMHRNKDGSGCWCGVNPEKGAETAARSRCHLPLRAEDGGAEPDCCCAPSLCALPLRPALSLSLPLFLSPSLSVHTPSVLLFANPPHTKSTN